MKAAEKIRELFRSFTGQMLVGMLFINIILIPLLFISIYLLVGIDYKVQFVNFSRTQSFQVAAQIGGAQDPEQIRRTLDDLVLSGLVRYAQYEMQGSQGISGMPTDNKVMFKEDFYFGGNGDDIYFISAEIPGKAGQPHAILRLGFDEMPLVERINVSYQRGFFIAVAYLVLTLVLVGNFGYFLTRSIRRLRDATHKIAEGDTNTDLTVETRITEVANLASDLEVMRSELVHREHVMKHLATYDMLTKLPNRLLFSDRLVQTLSYARRNKNITALFFIDLDRFKEINDTLGHEYGDLLLSTAAARMGDCIRREDTLARLGGDEFTLILSEIKQPENAEVVAKKILAELARPFHLNEREVSISGSIGIAVYPVDSATPEDLLSHADNAMYAAKKLGGNGFQYYQPENTAAQSA